MTHDWAQSLIYVLVIFSVLSWAWFAYRQWVHLQLKRDFRELDFSFQRIVAQQEPLSPNRLQDTWSLLALKSPLSRLMENIAHEWSSWMQAPAKQRLAVIEQRLQSFHRRQQQDLQSGIVILATIATTAPFVGLLGTVISVHDALISLAQLDVSQGIDPLIAPVGEALLMTAYGLMVAIPASFFNNILIKQQHHHQQALSEVFDQLFFCISQLEFASSNTPDHATENQESA